MVWSCGCTVCSVRCLLEGGSQFSLKDLSQLWGCWGFLPVCSVMFWPFIFMLFILHSFYNKWSGSWILLFFGVLRLCVGTEALTETLVELGHNATLSCSLIVTNAHWYLHRHPQPPLAILRSFSNSSPAAFYYNKNYRQKYSLETGNRLFIQNVTVDDCGVFYCAKKEEQSLLFSNGTRLMTTDYPSQQSNCRSSWENCLLSIYSVLNIILIVMILVHIVALACQNRNCLI